MKTMNYTFSLVIATYNSERTLPETLTSLETIKEAKNVEIIISDDASQDSTVKIARDWSKKHIDKFKAIKILAHPINIGISANHTEAFKQASSDYGIYMGGDDLISKDTIFISLDAWLVKHPEISVAKFNLESFYEETGIITPYFELQKPFFHCSAKVQFNILASFSNILACGPGTLVKISELKNLGYFDSDIRTFEDIQLNLKFAIAGHKTYFIPVKGMYWRRHIHSLSFTNFSNCKSNHVLDNEKILYRYVLPNLAKYKVLSIFLARYFYKGKFNSKLFALFFKTIRALGLNM